MANPFNLEKRRPALLLFGPSVIALRDNILTYFLLLILPAALSFGGTQKNAENPIEAVFYPNGYLIIGSLATILFFAPLIYTYVASTKRVHSSVIESIKEGLPYFWRLLAVQFIFAVGVIVGLSAFIIPGLIILKRYFLASYALVDKNLPVKEAFRYSRKITNGNGFFIFDVLSVILTLGIITVFSSTGYIIGNIGLMLYSVAPAFRYRELSDAHESNKSTKKLVNKLRGPRPMKSKSNKSSIKK